MTAPAPTTSWPPWTLEPPTHLIREMMTLVRWSDDRMKYAVIPIPPTPWHEVPRLGRPPESLCRNEIADRSRKMLSGEKEYRPGYFDGVPTDPKDAEPVARAWLIRRAEVPRCRDD